MNIAPTTGVSLQARSPEQTFEAAVYSAAQTGGRVSVDDDDEVEDVMLLTDINSADGGPSPAKVSRHAAEDAKSIDPVWRCLGLTPVTSFSIECRNLVDYRTNFRVQPVSFSATAVLPCVDIVVNQQLV